MGIQDADWSVVSTWSHYIITMGGEMTLTRPRQLLLTAHRHLINRNICFKKEMCADSQTYFPN